MSTYRISVTSPDGLPDGVEPTTDFLDVADAISFGARVVADWADRVQVTRGDIDRWKDELLSGFAITFMDEIDGEWTVRMREVIR